METLRCKYKKEAQREKGMKVSNEREKNKLETRVKRFENGNLIRSITPSTRRLI